MDMLKYTLLIMASLALIIFIIGLLLPKERTESRQTLFNASAEKVYNTVTNNRDWHYRNDLKDLKILEQKDEIEIWEETTKDGSIIKFRTGEKTPHSFYSFYMESNILTGYWTAEFKDAGNNKTLFIATEHIYIKNPFVKTLSYLFFDIGKMMENYQSDLHKKLAEQSFR
ncbi:hypothetical protein M2451_000623 [Dysgonomonas sp. PFB1-18]|uniref:hypothetical protein n=1 Tax=unclassified Dysgonomonas TaxID=2630389 RepID=UPI0024731229|nr:MULTISPECIES: hypothetical protein [unclassified Dysgonomonas]MDH6307474.1 hypothetical protein [Dysgonomonas sp. PF1-14]MDH6337392.1 hypothetical protein [Dysgonomonas sp. PF1-16]MDH6379316.1 hypothetical protein [Dysgonomonas sp. PFB1-18]MDH6396046.1 hypothetical protein [Dysgonomonas sp. PF1-23]